MGGIAPHGRDLLGRAVSARHMLVRCFTSCGLQLFCWFACLVCAACFVDLLAAACFVDLLAAACFAGGDRYPPQTLLAAALTLAIRFFFFLELL